MLPTLYSVAAYQSQTDFHFHLKRFLIQKLHNL